MASSWAHITGSGQVRPPRPVTPSPLFVRQGTESPLASQTPASMSPSDASLPSLTKLLESPREYDALAETQRKIFEGKTDQRKQGKEINHGRSLVAPQHKDFHSEASGPFDHASGLDRSSCSTSSIASTPESMNLTQALKPLQSQYQRIVDESGRIMASPEISFAKERSKSRKSTIFEAESTQLPDPAGYHSHRGVFDSPSRRPLLTTQYGDPKYVPNQSQLPKSILEVSTQPRRGGLTGAQSVIRPPQFYHGIPQHPAKLKYIVSTVKATANKENFLTDVLPSGLNNKATKKSAQPSPLQEISANFSVKEAVSTRFALPSIEVDPPSVEIVDLTVQTPKKFAPKQKDSSPASPSPSARRRRAMTIGPASLGNRKRKLETIAAPQDFVQPNLQRSEPKAVTVTVDQAVLDKVNQLNNVCASMLKLFNTQTVDVPAPSVPSLITTTTKPGPFTLERMNSANQSRSTTQPYQSTDSLELQDDAQNTRAPNAPFVTSAKRGLIFSAAQSYNGPTRSSAQALSSLTAETAHMPKRSPGISVVIPPRPVTSMSPPVVDISSDQINHQNTTESQLSEAEQPPTKRLKVNTAVTYKTRQRYDWDVPANLRATDARLIQIGRMETAYARHEAAPYAFTYQGKLRAAYSYLKHIHGRHGLPAWTPEEAQRLENWRKSGHRSD